MGAEGTAAIVRHLSTQHGHHAVELERYAMANKIWVTKVKRLRLPDLVCLRCGLRIESKAKTALEAKLSHSEKEGREWDAAMRAQDLFAFIKCDADKNPMGVAMAPVYFSVSALRDALPYAKEGARKSASRGVGEGPQLDDASPQEVRPRSARLRTEGANASGERAQADVLAPRARACAHVR